MECSDTRYLYYTHTHNQSVHQVRSALLAPLLVNPALSLENWTATTTKTIAAAAIVLKTSPSPVSLTQPLELDDGIRCFALQAAVAVRVGAGDEIVNN